LRFMVLAPKTVDVHSESAAAVLRETVCYVDGMQCIPLLSIFCLNIIQYTFRDTPTMTGRMDVL
jgi:hypothetical protein